MESLPPMKPTSNSQTSLSTSANYASLEDYPLEDIQLDPKTSTPKSRRHSSASILSNASSHAGKANKRAVSHTIERITTFAKRRRSRFETRARSSRYHGWRIGVLVGCCLSAFVLCCNITIVIVGGLVNGGYQGGMANLVFGSASEVSRWSVAAHLLINIFSTMLLGASNYTMQVLSSPTRDDIDKAHAKGKWLDVGILSTRNLRSISRRNLILWILLATSSVPLHLFYNAAVFQLSTHHQYRIFAMDVLSEEFRRLDSLTEVPKQGSSTHRSFLGQDWVQTYDAKYISAVDDIYLGLDGYALDSVQESSTMKVPRNYTLEIDGSQGAVKGLINTLWSQSGDWIQYRAMFATNSTKEFNTTVYQNSGEIPATAHVRKAISKNATTKSSLQISRDFMLVVIAFNVFKLVIMTWVLVADRSAYIVTLGDAVASFLEHPDPNTRLQCVLDKEDILFKLGHWPYISPAKEELKNLSLRSEGVWLPKRRDRYTVLGRDRQVFFALLLCITLAANVVVPLMSGPQPGGGFAWGTSSGVIINDGAGALTNAWIVNTPQLGLSFCYLALNSICTSLAGAEEWNNMARARKSLRVTAPEGEQRSTYFLQLPYRWIIPLMITSSTLHWLLSQSFFLVRLNVMDRQGKVDSSQSISACGFSQLSLMIFWAVATILVVSVASVAGRRMQQKMPIAASCSLVISAACHPPDDEKEPHLGKLRWGVVAQRFEGDYEHCCLTAMAGTKRPIMGRKYR